MPVFPKIREVHIRNYKSIAQAVVRLGDLTVLVGANGSGKSNFVDALAFVRECLSFSVEQALQFRGGYGSVCWRPNYLKDSVGIRLVMDFPGEVVADYAVEISLGEPRTVVVTAERCVVTHPDGSVHRFSLRNGVFDEEIPGIRARIEQGRLALFAASATQDYHEVYEFLAGMRAYAILPDRVGDIQAVNSGAQLVPDGGNSASVLRHLQEANPERFELVADLIRGLIPGVRGIGTTPAGALESVRFDEVGPSPGSTLAIEAARASDGTLRVLGLLLAAYQTDTPSVLMIEEPEANVHPAIAESLTSVLIDVSRRSQVIVTTHSPDILDHEDLSDGMFRVVAKLNGQTAIAPVAAAARQAMHEHLYSPGELLRIDELTADLNAARQLADGADLFGAPAHPIGEAA